MNNIRKISIVGGGGHIGFPLGLAFANKGFLVNLVDINEKNLNKIQSGTPPFYEIGAKKLLTKILKNKKFIFSKNLESIKQSKYIIICIGTPIDKNLKPKIRDFLSFFEKIKKIVMKNQIIIIRSSIYPGLIYKIYSKLKEANKNLAYCPERIVQSKALVELPILPQIISGFNYKVIKESRRLFKKICNKTIQTSLKEAELIKLFSNANRYINFAIANQLFMICNEYDVDFKRIRHQMQFGYERNINLANSGFTGGPCLLKDTMQLRAFYKNKFYLGTSSMKVNKGMIELVIKKLKKIKNHKKKIIGVLGMAFKAETDDIRDSLSIELIRKLKKKNLNIIYSDVYYKNKNTLDTQNLIKRSNIIIIGTPHKKYLKLRFPKNKIVIDIWGLKLN